MGTPTVTVFRDLNNKIVKYSYCTEVFDITKEILLNVLILMKDYN